MARLPIVIDRGTNANKPAAPTEGYLYFVTDVDGGKLQRYSGAAWEDVEGLTGDYDSDGDGYIDADSGGTDIDTSGSTGHPEINAGTWSVVLDNFSAAGPPDANDDAGSGYEIGSLWYDVTNDRVYVCMDASAAAAVWIEWTVPPGETFLSAAGMWPSTTSGCGDHELVEYGTNDVDVYVLPFDRGSNEYAQVTTVMPDDYDGGTVTCRFIWTSDVYYLGGTVVWGVQGIAYADGDPIDTAWGAAQTVSDDIHVADDEHVTGDTPAVTLAGSPAGGQRVQWRVYRNAAAGGDDLDNDARLVGVVVKYTRRTS